MAPKRVFIVGTGVVGEALIRDASSRGQRITALEADGNKAEQLGRLKGIQVIRITDFSLDELRDAGISRANLVLATSDSDEQNMRVITYCADLGASRVGALASDESHREIFQRLGAETVVVPAKIVSDHLFGMFLSPSAVYDAVLNDGSRIVQILVNESSLLHGRSPGDSDLLDEGQWIIDVRRGGEHVRPTAVEAMEVGDLVTVFFAQQPTKNAVLSSNL